MVTKIQQWVIRLYIKIRRYDNTAVGYQALYGGFTTAGPFAKQNTAVGSQALYTNGIGVTTPR